MDDVPFEVPFDELRGAVARFRDLFGVDGSMAVLLAATAPRIDLGRPGHREALHRWLNAWGCRIRYRRPGEPDPFDVGMAAWWRRRGTTIRSIREPLAELTDVDIARLADAYGDLASVTIAHAANGTARTMAPTAAAKSLHALLPAAVMPWDLEIARQLHGARDAPAFAAHLRLGRRWAADLLRSSGLDESALVAELGAPSASLARLLDQYCYLRCTLGLSPSALRGRRPRRPNG